MMTWEDYVPIIACHKRRKNTNAFCERPIDHEFNPNDVRSWHGGRDYAGRFHIWDVKPTQLVLFYD